MLARLKNQWFLLALAACFTAGYAGRNVLQPLLDVPWLRESIVFGVMWAMGVTLQANTIRSSFTRPLPSLLSVAVNIAVVPLICLPTMWFLPPHLFGGLFVTSVVPCTLASASVWTRKAGGDDSVAMMTTVITNLACVVVAPVGIYLVLSQQTQIDVVQQVQKLSLVVVAPLILAQSMRLLGCASWADRNQSKLSIFSQFGILSMVVFGAVASARVVANQQGGGASPMGVFTLLVLVITAASVHTLSLGLGVVAARACQIARARQIAIGIAGSQKTLMVGLQIAIDCGVSVVPMLVYHLSQLVIDTVVAQRWKAGSRHETG